MRARRSGVRGVLGAKARTKAGGGGAAATPGKLFLEGAAEGTADVVSVPELKSASTTIDSATETAF